MSDVYQAYGPAPTSPTLEALTKKYGPAVPLKDVCGPYWGLTYRVASRKALLNALPVPAFRLRDSERAPWMIRATQLAEHIDQIADESGVMWDGCQPEPNP